MSSVPVRSPDGRPGAPAIALDGGRVEGCDELVERAFHQGASRRPLEGRMDAAEALLLRTRLTVTAVAYLCGFSDPAHLANTCRRLRRTTPTSLRDGAEPLGR